MSNDLYPLLCLADDTKTRDFSLPTTTEQDAFSSKILHLQHTGFYCDQIIGSAPKTACRVKGTESFDPLYINRLVLCS